MIFCFTCSHVVHLSNAGSSTAVRVQQPIGSETDTTAPDAALGGSSVALTPLLPPTSLTTDLEAAAKESALKMKIRSLTSQVCKLKAKMRDLNRLKKTSKAGVNKESVMKQLKKLLPAKAYAFVGTQMRMVQRKAQGQSFLLGYATYQSKVLQATVRSVFYAICPHSAEASEVH